MGYGLAGIVTSEPVPTSIQDRFSALRSVGLAHEFRLIPMGWSLYTQVCSGEPLPEILLGENEDMGSIYTQSVEWFCRELSGHFPVAWVEAEFFGGEGLQASAVWRHGECVRPFSFGDNLINIALAEIGVVKETGQDEFDTLCLGRHRDTESWLRSKSSQRSFLKRALGHLMKARS